MQKITTLVLLAIILVGCAQKFFPPQNAVRTLEFANKTGAIATFNNVVMYKNYGNDTYRIYILYEGNRAEPIDMEIKYHPHYEIRWK